MAAVKRYITSALWPPGCFIHRLIVSALLGVLCFACTHAIRKREYSVEAGKQTPESSGPDRTR